MFQFRLLGRLIDWYLTALMNGNPFAVAVAILAAVALGTGPFYEGLKSGDTVAIVLASLVGVGVLFVLVIAVVDRKLNGQKKKARPADPRLAAKRGGRTARTPGR
jgi:hypothetical protein